MEVLFYPFALLIAVIGGGLVPGILLCLARLRCRARLTRFSHRLVLFGCRVWFCCGLYATRRYGWLQTVPAPIRVDLLRVASSLTGLIIRSLAILVKGLRYPVPPVISAEVADVD